MAQKDIQEKILMAHADVFADCENALAYGGKRRLRPENMQPAPTESFYQGKDKIHNQFSDVAAYLMEALTNDTRFTDLVEELLKRQQEGKEIVMCEYIDMLEARGEAKGRSVWRT